MRRGDKAAVLFESSLTQASSVSLAALPRVFLTPVVPGWTSPNGNIHLPLMMDGATVDIGIHKDDDRALSEWVNARKSYFASDLPEFDLYPTRDSYRAAVHPPWLEAAAARIGHTVGSYASSQPETSRLRVVSQHLLNRWSGMLPLVSALLYMPRIPYPTFTLFAQDLSLYGPTLEDSDELYSLLDLLSTVTHIDDLLREEMTDRVVVRDDEGGRVRELHDVFATPADPALVLRLFDSLGNPVSLQKAEVRPTCTFVLDDEEKINPFRESPTSIHSAFDLFQAEMLSRNRMVTGAYLMAQFRFEDEEVRDLERRISPHVSRSPDLSTDEERDIVAAHLRSTGRGQGMRTNEYAASIAKVLRKLGLTQ